MTELDKACEALRKAIHDEQKVQDVKTSWKRMSLTCTQKKAYEKRWTSDIYGRR